MSALGRIVVAVVVLFATVTAQAEKWPKPAAGRSASGQPELIFTFDDGPDHRFTPRVLKILRERQIQAIFFWVGHRIDQTKANADRRRAAATRAVLEGHLVGTHTVNHAHLCQKSIEEGGWEIDHAVTEIGKLTGLPMVLFRAPYGDHCDKLIGMLDARNLEHMHWDIDPHEWLDHDSDRVADEIIHDIRNLDAGARAVVLMHDTKLVTVRALEIVLSWIDKENQRRRDRGRPTIRIVDASDWVAETLDPELVLFTEDLVSTTFGRAREAATTLLPGAARRVVKR